MRSLGIHFNVTYPRDSVKLRMIYLWCAVVQLAESILELLSLGTVSIDWSADIVLGAMTNEQQRLWAKYPYVPQCVIGEA